MSSTLLLFVAITLQFKGSSEFSKYLSEFDGAALSRASVTQQCMVDMAIFGMSLARFAATVKECMDQGGCTDEQKKTLGENMFAVQQLDAFGKIPAGIMEVPVVSPGSYHECRTLIAPYKTHYCYAEVALKNFTVDLIGQLRMAVAVCMPLRCTEQDIPLLLETLINGPSVPVEFPSAKCVPLSVKPTAGFWVFMTLMVFFVVWAIIASGLDYILDTLPNSDDIRKSKAIRILLSFSFYTNASLLLSTQPPKEGTIRSMASIRFISMAWVASGHVLTQSAASDSLIPVLSLWDPLLSTAFTNAFLSVDTFFLLSGILVGYLFFKTRPSRRFVTNPFTWIMFYVHRYLRLTPPMMMFIGLFTVLLPFTNGPWMASRPKGFGMDIDSNVEVCQKYWWKNMLYINNLFGHDTECYGISWYLAVDTQLYLVAPIFLVALYLSPFIGVALLFLSCAASVAYTYIITIRDDLPSSELVAFLFQRHEQLFFDEYYEMPWVRCPPYLIGLGVGYLLARIRGKKPRLHWIFVVAMWMISIWVSLLSVYGPHDYIKGDEDWSTYPYSTTSTSSRRQE